MDRITANTDSLFSQAPMTADAYLDAAVRAIDSRFGSGFAEMHPELIAAHMQTSAIDFGASVIARALEAIADRPADPLD